MLLITDKTNKKYFETDQESDEDFSPDVSEYAPSPSSNIFKSPLSSVSSLSGDSACINKIIAFPEIISTPSTISNLSLYLTNADFVASSSEIYNNKATLDLSHPIIEKENQSRPNIRRTISSQEYIDDTFKPDETLEINHNETLTGRTSNDCSHAREVVTDNEDSPSLIRKICSEEENNETLRPEEQSESNNDTTLTGRTSSDCEHMEAVENEKKLTRKRKQNRSEWRSKKNKILKNSGKAYEGCNTKKKYPEKTIGSPCACKKGCGQKFSPSERQAIFDKFYSLADREHQWLYISRYVQAQTIKRMTLDRKNNRTQTLNYFFPNSNNEKIPVCKKYFLNTLQIGEYVVYTAMEKVMKADEGLKDKRGRHDNRPNKMNTMTEATIKTHIELFPKVQSHYTRATSNREYLSENLNISKMFRFYTEWFTEQNHTDVVMATKRQYETVFNSQYNYSFFKPKKDQCLSCSIYEQSDDTMKATLEEKQRLHLQRKEKVRSLKKGEIETADKSNVTVAIFDLQKVLSVPQSEVGVFHYKRKYPCYNFTVFDAVRKIGYCYVWHYQIAKRGSSEIGSALLSFFKTEREKGITKFSLYSDGCYGQNKNRYIFALYVYAAKLFDITITHRFFETGHSQNEGDSMHACIEKNLKNKVLYTPDQIYSIILNSKITGEKYRIKELEQSEVYDLKPLVEDKYWRCDKDGNVIRWADVMEVSVVDTQANKLFFKYNFEDSYSELDINNTPSTSARRRGRKRTSTQDAAVYMDNIATRLPPTYTNKQSFAYRPLEFM
ncbi:unnamed protein product [Spodoptera littoralis]|uniref:DUF7869 domain-containing protein n=1 Tax=Spodoptera littoralis TaxID=7109 RepID=A0A9P0IBW5_SPOLI|nr:unnamed protein product [Spodoptera littoralis]